MLALYIVAGIILFLLLILLVPVDFTLNYKTGAEEKATLLRAHWFFGLVAVDLRKRLKKPGRRKTRGQSWQQLRRFGTDPKTLSALLKFARRLACTLKVKRLSGYLQFGFDDPVDTGMVFGLIQPLFSCVSLPPASSFRIEPDFSATDFKVDVEGRFRAYPFKVAVTAVGFVRSSEGRHTIRRFISRHTR